jgi:hypothetical protein
MPIPTKKLKNIIYKNCKKRKKWETFVKKGKIGKRGKREKEKNEEEEKMGKNVC